MEDEASKPKPKKRISLRCERRDAVQNRYLIRAAAEHLFRAVGSIENVNMHQIAKAAGVGQGTLYRHYAHKANLCLDMLKESSEAFLQETQTWIEVRATVSDEMEILKEVITRTIDFTDTRLALLLEVDNASFMSDNPFYRQIHEMISRLLEPIVARQPALQALNPTFTADMILSAIGPRMFIFERQVRGYSKVEFLTNILNTYIVGFLRGNL